MTPALDAIGLAVTDMTASLAFYRDLGLPVPAGAEAEPHVDVELAGGFRLMLDTVDLIRSFDPGFAPPAGAGRIGLAVRCADPAEVDEVHARMVAAGHASHHAPWDAPWGQRYATLLDPDHTSVDLYAPLKPA